MALPMSNIGRFWSSTIWICRPSGVTSMRICERYSFSVALLEIMASILARKAWMRWASCCARWRLVSTWRRWLSLSASERLTWPYTLVRSLPPPGMTLELLPEPSPPAIATLRGELKYAAIPCRSPLEVEPSSHISRKKAIIAVMKSA